MSLKVFLFILPIFILTSCVGGGTYNSKDEFNLQASTNVGSYFSKKIPSSLQSPSYSLINPPTGMSINKKTGIIYWTPTPNQKGVQKVDINISGSIKTLTIDIKGGSINTANSIFISPNGDDSNNGDYNLELKTTKKYCTSSDFLKRNITIYFRGGEYDSMKIKCAGDSSGYVTIKPWGNERVKIKFDQALGVRLTGDYVKFQGFEIEGVAKDINYTQALSNWWIGDRYYNGTGIVTNGSHVEVSDCIVHDAPSSGISAKGGDYITFQNNIVYNCAWWTIAGTKGIGATDSTASDDDNSTTHIKIQNNLIFDVESRIFSRVWSKGKAHLTIDEGEAILVQVNDANYTARYLIKNNFLLFNGKGVVANKTNKADMLNNTLYQSGTTISGNFKGLRGNSTHNTTIKNNAVNIVYSGYAYNMGGNSSDITLSNNCIDGNDTNIIAGLHKTTNIFQDPQNLNFTPTQECQNTGADLNIWQILKQKADSYGIEIKPTNWSPNYIDITKQIIANIPQGANIDYSTWDDNNPFDLNITNIPAGVSGRPSEFILEVEHPYHRN